jgi:hypothetical protein
MMPLLGDADTRELIETGMEPEYFVSAMPRAEIASVGNVRLYLAAEKHGILRLEYTAVVPIELLAAMGRQLLDIAARGHNVITLEPRRR